jgi:nucleoside-diphosphate-sugar epimerase
MKVAITGASGFVGTHLSAHLLAHTAHEVIGISRQVVSPRSHEPRIQWRQADLNDVAAMVAALADVDVVVNLAWPAGGVEQWPGNLAEATRLSGASRLVHTSTAVVAGRTADAVVTEATVPRPATAYEQAKLAVEQTLTRKLGSCTQVSIVRPTAIFGPHGRNLAALAASLLSNRPMTNACRRMLFGSRQMHLVPVTTVVRAYAFLIDREQPLPPVLHVSADEDAENTFATVERRLLKGLGHEAPLRLPSLPQPVLSAVLRMRGRSDSNPGRRYSGALLTGLGFRGGEAVGPAVEAFGRWYADGAWRVP